MAKNYEINQSFGLKEDVVYRIVGGEAIILDVARGEHFSLNKTGTEIFLDIVNNMSLNQIFEKQKKRYRKAPTLKQDIIDLIEELLKKKIIERRGT